MIARKATTETLQHRFLRETEEDLEFAVSIGFKAHLLRRIRKFDQQVQTSRFATGESGGTSSNAAARSATCTNCRKLCRQCSTVAISA
ncbi:MAG: hypothetical protein R3C28_28655 [Pirellulaceae bacterium]